MNRTRLLLSLLAAATSLAVASPASAADVAPGTSFAGLVDQGKDWLRAAAAGPTAASDPTAPHSTTTPTGELAAAERRSVAEQQPFFDLSPNASIVARDWRGSLKIVGERTMLVDDLRPTASNRMVMGRVATAGRSLSIFAQAGAGEWRVDTVMFPNAVSDSELAGQAGAGFELRLPRGLRIAGELDYTMLYRDLRYAEGQVAPRMTSFVLAAAGTF